MKITEERLTQVYGKNAARAKERLENVESHYKELFGSAEPDFFTSPGRTEIIGNHTDHNGGKVIAGSISMDTIAAAAPSGNDLVRIVSEGYPGEICIDLTKLDGEKPGNGTYPLVVGLIKGMQNQGYQVGGFCAYVSTDVIAASGVSSSASFEMLICTMIDHFFNSGKMNYIEYAKAGQYSENEYWGKKSGLMDQLACAVGGVIKLDFSGEVTYEKVDFDLDSFEYGFVLVNSTTSHADLSPEYSAVPEEMFAVANALSVKRLCDTSLEELTANLKTVKEKTGCDRGILRALHFFTENERVEAMEKAMKEKDSQGILRLLQASGDSSYKLLQNCYVPGKNDDQGVALNLGVSEYLNRKMNGVCRIHGGGFAGVILECVPEEHEQEYIDYMTAFAGSENVYPLRIRNIGAVKL